MTKQKLGNNSGFRAEAINVPCRFFAELKEAEVKIKVVGSSKRLAHRDYSDAGLCLMSVFEGTAYRLTAK
jgi:uncharacterized Fe-S cluster-containing protein